MFETIKRFYDQKIYTKQHILNIVRHGVLTPEQYYEITGDKYNLD